MAFELRRRPLTMRVRRSFAAGADSDSEDEGPKLVLSKKEKLKDQLFTTATAIKNLVANGDWAKVLVRAPSPLAFSGSIAPSPPPSPWPLNPAARKTTSSSARCWRRTGRI